MQKIAINVCDCDGMHEDFPLSTYRFNEAGDVELPDLCPNSDLTQSELTHFYSLLEITETNPNWILYSIYRGRVARIRDNLYFHTFGDVDEVGDSNFYIEGTLAEVVEYFLSEMGEFGPDWRRLLKHWAANGIPRGYDSGKLTKWLDVFTHPNPELVMELEGLEVSIYLNLEDEELVRELKSL